MKASFFYRVLHFGNQQDVLVDQIKNVTDLTWAQYPLVAELMSRTFFQDPMMIYIYPSHRERKKLLQCLFAIPIKYSLLYGQVHTTPDLEGVACWLLPDQTRPSFFRMLRAGMIWLPLRMGKDPWKRFYQILTYSEEVHMRVVSEPHWQLWMLGVSPPFQQQGIGSQLIKPILKQADLNSLPCYLDTFNENNLAFYQKHHFYVVHKGEIPNSNGLLVWAMVREPQESGI